MSTRRDFERTAQVIQAQVTRDSDQPAIVASLKEVATAFATTYQAENPRFNPTRFLTACGF